MHKQLFTLSMVALLAACGGGSETSANNESQKDSTTQASETTATALGAIEISDNANEKAYDLVADIGDTWRITFNSTTGEYKLAITDTQYGLKNVTGKFGSTISGNFVTYTLNESVGTLVLDSRTKAISGNMKVGDKTTTVAGSGYITKDISKLAATYNIVGATRNLGGGSPDFMAGQMRIDDKGVATVCIGGLVKDNACTPVPGGPSPENAVTLKLTLDNFGKITAKAGDTVATATSDFGLFHVHASDLGKALVIDRFGKNEEGTHRVGTFYAVEAKKLSETAANGTWKCSGRGNELATAVVNGTENKLTLKTASGVDEIATEKLYWNYVNKDNKLIDWNGFGVSVLDNNISEGVIFLPISTSFAAVESDQQLTICRKAI
jgi:hypothetical protein